MNDKDLVSLTCADCHKSFQLSYGRFRRFPSDYPFLCSNCQNIKKSKDAKTRYQNMSEQERYEWQTKMKSGYNNRSDEQKKATSIKISQIQKNIWNEKSNEDKKQFSEKIRNSLETKSDEEKTQWKSNISKSQKKLWDQLTLDERKQKMASLFEGNKQYNESMSEEESRRVGRLISDGLKRYWSTVDPTEKSMRYEKISEAKKKYWDSLSLDEQVDHMKLMWDAQTNIGPTEIQFQMLLSSNGFRDYIHGFSTYDIDYIHPDFFNIFGKYNSITNELNYPYHCWDFMITTKSGPLILVDVDGSIHNPNRNSYVTNHAGTKFSMYDFMKYQDSKRPYQIPNGFDAFVIICYDDNLSDKSEVQRLGINIDSQPMTLKSFMDILLISQLTQKELDEIIRNI